MPKGARPFPHPGALRSLRGGGTATAVYLRASPGRKRALTRRQHRQRCSRRCAQEEDGREEEEEEEKREDRGRVVVVVVGGASTASQEAGGERVAMQMGSVHIANHWSLSALQRKSLFRQNSRN